MMSEFEKQKKNPKLKGNVIFNTYINTIPMKLCEFWEFFDQIEARCPQRLSTWLIIKITF